MKAIRTTCAYCGVGCGITARVIGDRSVSITGDREHPANAGRLCSKGTHLGETVGLEGRLLHPRINGNRVSWEAALDSVAGRMAACMEQHGPDSVAFYVSGQLLTEDYYAANKLMKGFIGSGNIDTNSRLCMASAVAAQVRAFGEDVVPCSYEDLDAADLILLVGSNTAWCHPVVWQRIEKARERRGTKIVVIDPRRTETAEQADLHVAVPPDGDVALFNALLYQMRSRGLLDEAFLADRVEADADFWSSLSPGHGVDPGAFRKLCGLLAAHPRTVTLFSQGANQSICGTDKGNAIINLHLATGRINRIGAGPFSITGQPNAMGGREVGGLATMLACHLGFSADEREAVAGFWNAPTICSGPGLKAVDMFRAIHSGKIKFVWIMATNPAVSLPDSGFVREALARCPNVVVSEVISDTDTARFAHVLLPAHAWGEKDGTVTNSERRVSRQRAFLAPPGETRADWEIIAGVASRLGWGDAFSWQHPADVFREFAAMTGLAAERGKALDITGYAGLDRNGYEALAPFQWGGERPLASGFPTADGRARLVPVKPAGHATGKDFPLRLNTARYRDQWHTMTRTGLSPTLSQHRPEPILEICSADAVRAGLTDRGLVKVETMSGESVFRVGITDAQRAGEVSIPMHWSDAMAGEGRTNRLPCQDVDPVSGQPGFKNTAARVSPVKPAWRAFMATSEAFHPDGLLYWSRSRVSGGWLYELAGNGPMTLDEWLPDGEQLEALDKARGMRRIAVRNGDGALVAAAFITRTGELPSRRWIASQLGTLGANASEVLAGRPSKPAPDRGPIVCVCHGIGEKDIAVAHAGGAQSVTEIGKATCAGTNCGSCRPALAILLDRCAVLAEEELS
ncbi:assimilatory nitrate reductase catalytic subunit [Novosphingobium marinum]|uniref:Assimilatory nitrate reductase catalytic subunit n=1 Tax=Novosphingobium marinum TaxID=1514948 RepID=A0A7Y9XYL6_9SPHN|nr:nitrate reductase [Novosphingobium marinum]NYH95488.1 assimilatory nitrate reductase catalytic subunit [Novosphingobium marinum]GGC27479.1 assimilatory nitrate reductase catalytic subunit [Novosphingobium marinum]